MLLTLRNGPNQGQTVPIGDAPVIFGRQNSATITLDDKKVSREHAVIEKSPDGSCVLRDLDSTNHTYLNGRPIRSAVLEDGDVLRIGGTEIGFSTTSACSNGSLPKVEDSCTSETSTPASISNAIDAFIDEDSISLSLEISPQMIQHALRQESSSDQGLLESLYALAQITNPETSDIDLLEASIKTFADAIDFDHWVWLEWKSDADEDYQVVVTSDASGATIPCDRVQPSLSLLQSARRSNRCMVSEELSREFEKSMALRTDDVASALVVPVSQRDGSRALYLERTGASPPFTARDLERATVLTTTLCGAVENSRLFGELKGAYDNLDRYLNELNRNEKLASIGRLASGFAHDLNNPLSSVLGFLELASRVVDNQLEGDIQAKLAKYLSKAQGAADFCRALSRNVLSFARQTPFDDAQPLPFNVHDTINNTLAICDSSLRRTGAEITVDVPADLSLIGDSSALQQLVMNLVTNASDAIGESGRSNGKIAIRARRMNETIQLEIEDNGPGIPDQIRNRIFEPLFTTKGENRGTGLGLHVVSTLIANAGGKLDFTSEIGRGTTFKVELPEKLCRTQTDLSAPIIEAGEGHSAFTPA